LRLNIVPAGVGNALDAAERVIEFARGTIQSELAPPAQLIVMSLHAEQHPAFTTADVTAEFVDVGGAGSLHRFDGRSYALSQIRLGG
jgi:hypothetical protein